MNRTIAELKNAAGASLAMIGWFTFATALLGTIAACFGAAMGSRQNMTSPLTMWVRPRTQTQSQEAHA